MSDNETQHLDKKQLVRAVIDLSDLTAGQKSHLDTCETCRNKLSHMGYQLKELGRIAQYAVPKPKAIFRLSKIPKSHTGIAFGWKRKSALVFSMLAIVFMAIVWIPKLQNQTTGIQSAQNSLELADVEKFMNEIDALVENAMPTEFQELTWIVEQPEDKNFMDFVVPDVEDPALGELSGGKGALV